MSDPREPLFVARQGYRRRRLSDAARLLPVLGLCLFGAPVLWGGAHRTSGDMIFLFIAWAVLILLALILSRALRRAAETRD